MKRVEIIEKLSSDLDNLKKLVNDECFNPVDIAEYYDIPYTTTNRTTISSYLDSIGVPPLFPKINKRDSRIILRYSSDIEHWWDNKYLADVILNRLQNNLIINYADKDKKIARYVIAFQGHPKASSSNQVKAHILLWEYHNKKLFPEGWVLVPKDGNFTNLTIGNFDAYTNEEYRSIVATGERNHFYTTGSQNGVCYKGGWKQKSKKLLENGKCAICGKDNKFKLNIHHIINYHLFEKPKEAHFDDNLICLCDSCHQKVHLEKIKLLGHISETRCEKLLELLETLKEKYKDNRIKMNLINFSIKSISSQASSNNIEGEGSTTISKESTSQANGDGSEGPLTDNAEGDDIV